MYSALVQHKDDNYSAGTWYTIIVWLTRLDQSEPVAHPYRLEGIQDPLAPVRAALQG